MDPILLSAAYYIVSLCLLQRYSHKFSVSAQMEYHNFSDRKGDVLSNLAFILAGMYQYRYDRVLALHTVLVALGSAYYHRNPTMKTLLWDRLPMVLEMAYILHGMLGLNYYILAGFCVLVLMYWYRTLDLLPYCALQAAICILLLVNGTWTQKLSVLVYGLAKFCEDHDNQIWLYTDEIVSGHTLKHAFAALSVVWGS